MDDLVELGVEIVTSSEASVSSTAGFAADGSAACELGELTAEVGDCVVGWAPLGFDDGAGAVVDFTGAGALVGVLAGVFAGCVDRPLNWVYPK